MIIDVKCYIVAYIPIYAYRVILLDETNTINVTRFCFPHTLTLVKDLLEIVFFKESNKRRSQEIYGYTYIWIKCDYKRLMGTYFYTGFKLILVTNI